MELVIEVVGTTNNVLERQRVDGNRVRIGRGYGNDLILSDAHADVYHAEISTDEHNRVWLRDLGSVNGTRRFKARSRLQETEVKSGDVFAIGRNRIRVFYADHELPAAVPLRPIESFLLWLGKAPVIVSLLLIHGAVTYSKAQSAVFGEFNWSAFLREEALGVLAFAALVAGVYLLSVLFRRGGNFLSHLSILLFVGLLSTAIEFLLDLARYNGGDHLYPSIDWLAQASSNVVIFLYLWSVLYLAFNLSVKTRTATSAAAVLAMLSFSFLSKTAFEEAVFMEPLPKERTFLTPSLQIARPIAPDAFDERITGVFDAVDAKRRERLEERTENAPDGTTDQGASVAAALP